MSKGKKIKVIVNQQIKCINAIRVAKKDFEEQMTKNIHTNDNYFFLNTSRAVRTRLPQALHVRSKA